jgi:hypothetical protein
MKIDLEGNGLFVTDNGMDDGGINIGWKGSWANMSLELDEVKTLHEMLGKVLQNEYSKVL